MPLPALDNWEKTRTALHQATQVIGAIRVASVMPMPNDLQYSVDPLRGGISSGMMDNSGRLVLNFTSGGVQYDEGGTVRFTVPLEGHHQISLMDTLLEQLQASGKTVEPDRKKIIHNSPFEIDPAQAADYAGVLDAMYTMLARFRARLAGLMSPLVLWPHHFDLSFLWFMTDGFDEHKDPHLNFGFAPEGSGFSRPYIYAYAWPMPDGLTETELPGPAMWHNGDWTGLVIPYDELRHAESPDLMVEVALTVMSSAAVQLISQGK